MQWKDKDPQTALALAARVANVAAWNVATAQNRRGDGRAAAPSWSRGACRRSKRQAWRGGAARCRTAMHCTRCVCIARMALRWAGSVTPLSSGAPAALPPALRHRYAYLYHACLYA
jgi:hypothetical protein